MGQMIRVFLISICLPPQEAVNGEKLRKTFAYI